MELQYVRNTKQELALDRSREEQIFQGTTMRLPVSVRKPTKGSPKTRKEGM